MVNIISGSSLKRKEEYDNGIYQIQNANIKDIKDIFNIRRLDKLPIFIQNALIVTQNALDKIDELQIDKSRVGIFASCDYGYLVAAEKFLGDAFVKGGRFVSPTYFPNTVSNSVSGWLSIVFSITGINTTIVGGRTAGINSLSIAKDYIEAGVVDYALVVSTETVDNTVVLQDTTYNTKYLDGAICLILSNEGEKNNWQIQGSYQSNIQSKLFEELKSLIQENKNIKIIISNESENVSEIPDDFKKYLFSNVVNNWEGYSLNGLDDIANLVLEHNDDIREFIVIVLQSNGPSCAVYLKRR